METKQLEPIWDHITPSSGVRAMIDGINKFRDHKNFILNMDTYGGYLSGDNMCHGCAATCTIFHLVNEEPNEDNIKQDNHPINGFTKKSIIVFESAIDDLRSGDLAEYLYYFPIPESDDHTKQSRVYELQYEFENNHDIDLMDFVLDSYPEESEIDQFLEVMEQVEQFLKKKGL